MKKMSSMDFHLAVAALLFFLFFNPVLSSAGELYKWVDEEGTVHMTDNLGNVPFQYRDQVEKRAFQTTTEHDFQLKSQGSADHGSAESPISDPDRFEVPYKAFEGNARRIIIPVTFNNRVTADLLLDTGSPGLLISPRLADRLGLLKEEDRNLKIVAGGIGGTVPAMLAIWIR